ncbi:MAG: DUF2922 domain-containing protein [Thermotogaceae bacterium]|nr:DUF2922 domain-containing protein [Thermotogaceae bacterium]
MKRLALTFRTPEGNSRTLYIPDPVDTLDATMVHSLMDAMIGTIVPADYQKDRAAVIDTQTQVFFDLIQ